MVAESLASRELSASVRKLKRMFVVDQHEATIGQDPPRHTTEPSILGTRPVALGVTAPALADQGSGLAFAARLSEIARDQELHVCAIVLRKGPLLAAAGSDARAAAQRDLLQWLQCASVVGANDVVVRPFDGAADRATCADTTADVLDTLCAIRQDVEALGVHLTLDAAGTRFLRCPAEAADFLDDVNSHAIGWQLDIERVERDSLFDFVHDLARSLRVINLPQRDDGLDRLGSVLREIEYNGPLVAPDPNARVRWTERLEQ